MNPEPLSKLWPLADVVFRRLFDEPDLLMSLINALLHLPEGQALCELTIQPTQIAGPLAGDKEVVLDVRAKTQDGRHFHVEVQVSAFAAYVSRILHYWSGMYHGQLEAGRGYKELQPVVSIHILGFDLLAEALYPRYHHIFELLERRDHHRLSDHLQIHTIEMPKFLRQVAQLSTDEDRWLYYLMYGDKLSKQQVHELGLPAIDKAEEKLRVISQDRDLRVLFEQRMKAQRDAEVWRKDWEAQWREDGEKLGLEKGKKLGLDEGKKLGLDEGKKLGLRTGIAGLCSLLGIEMTAERQAHLEGLDLAGLERLQARLLSERTWPA